MTRGLPRDGCSLGQAEVQCSWLRQCVQYGCMVVVLVVSPVRSQCIFLADVEC